jgi:hypothetical protein
MNHCAKDECRELTVGKSKYCAPHRDAARAAWVEMIANKPSKEDRDKAHVALHTKARIAGMQAADACTPTPMVVERHANQLDDSSPVVERYAPVRGGVCGFAWVNIKPGNSSFALYLVKNGIARKDSYYGGVSVWVSEFGQSMERKAAYAAAYAQVLRDAGIERVYAQSRMD